MKQIDLVFEIPTELVNSAARFWRGFTQDFVFKEEVAEWLRENLIRVDVRPQLQPRLPYPVNDEAEYPYNVYFFEPNQAILFKMRWFGVDPDQLDG